jgi:lysozyme
MYLREHRRRRHLRSHSSLGDALDDGAINGVDVSRWNGVIDWSKARAAGVEFAYINAGDGMAPDPQFAANWAAAGRAGVLRGAYHFFRPGLDPDLQAQFFLGRLAEVGGPGDLPPAIDVEAHDNQNATVITTKAKRWISAVKSATGRMPIFFTYFYFWRDNMGAPDLSSSPLWLSQVTTAPTPPIMPSAWPRWSIWQWSHTGSVPGFTGPVDLNRFNGTRAELRALGGGGSTIVSIALLCLGVAAYTMSR